MPTNKGRRFAPEPLTPDEVRLLLAANPGKRPIAVRNRALIAVLWRSGLRVSEALALYPRDVDERAGTVNVRNGKGGTYRLANIDQEALAHLHAWMELRRSMGINGRHPIFCSIADGKGGKGVRKPGQPINPAYVRALLPRLAKRAGIDKRVHAHGLRHAHATEMVAAGLPLHVIAGQLGHASTATTDAYLAKIAPAERLAAMRAAGWSMEPPADDA